MQKIHFYHENIQKIKIDKKLTKTYLKALIEEEAKKTGNISVIFCSDDYLHKINREYLDHDYYTDIITFDYCEKESVAGDIFISTDRVKDNSVKYKVEFQKELYRVLFHGILHLIGFKDRKPTDKTIMKEKEDYYLKKFLG